MAPPVRTAALSLLLLLLLLFGGVVAMATAERGPSCQQEIPADLLRQLWRRTRVLINTLPTRANSSKAIRLLPRFCIGCPKGAIGWLEIRELIDIYVKRVFGCDVIKKLLPLHYNHLLYRLQETLDHCVSSSKPSKSLGSLRKLEKKLKKRKRSSKAVSEFPFVLRWVDELLQQRGGGGGGGGGGPSS